jgi:hypothetical protein
LPAPLKADLTPHEAEFGGSRWWRFDDVVENGPIEFDPNLPLSSTSSRGSWAGRHRRAE